MINPTCHEHLAGLESMELLLSFWTTSGPQSYQSPSWGPCTLMAQSPRWRGKTVYTLPLLRHTESPDLGRQTKTFKYTYISQFNPYVQIKTYIYTGCQKSFNPISISFQIISSTFLDTWNCLWYDFQYKETLHLIKNNVLWYLWVHWHSLSRILPSEWEEYFVCRCRERPWWCGCLRLKQETNIRVRLRQETDIRAAHVVTRHLGSQSGQLPVYGTVRGLSNSLVSSMCPV